MYVAEAGNGKVLGYYTLSAASLRHDELPESLAHRLPKYPVPAVLIGRMASDRQARAVRPSHWLAPIDPRPPGKPCVPPSTIGVQCVIVDSKPEAVAFYQRFGFIPLTEDGLKLYLPISTIKTLEGHDD